MELGLWLATPWFMGCLNFDDGLWVAWKFQPEGGLSILLVSSCFHLEFADAFIDTILQGQSITTSQTIVFVGGDFELGFFSLGNSTKYYVGTWYKKVSKQTIVWVANRGYSFTNLYVVLTVIPDGNLEIWEGKILYKVTNVSSNRNTGATLLDAGKFVLRNEKSDILW